jgi:ABC-type Fe3+/spermidine/putrescine transport system ATPase subunit
VSESALRVASLLVRRSSRRSAFELRVDALELQRGSVLAVLGPNGAGKSTLLRTLAGLEEPLRGQIERSVDGPVTMVFQRPIAFSGSVAHNLKVALSGLSLARGERAARVEEALRHFDIARLADRRTATLSGGELRRLALARAFALHPAVLLLDEPFDDLDSSGEESLSLDLKEAIASTGVAVAVVTHDLRRALLLSDRIAVLLDGRVAQEGDRERVLSRPASLEVARLVGMSNLVEGLVRADSSQGELELSRVEIDAHHHLPVQTSLPPVTRVWAGVRPERLKVDVGRGEGLPVGKGVVESVVSDGVAVTVQVGWAGYDLRTHLLAGRGLARTIAPGDSVTLSVRPEDVHLIERL